MFIKDKRSKITDYLWKFSTFRTFDARTCGNLVLFALLMPVDYQFLSCFVNNVFGKFGEKVYSCGGLERVGRVTVNTAFFFLPYGHYSLLTRVCTSKQVTVKHIFPFYDHISGSICYSSPHHMDILVSLN